MRAINRYRSRGEVLTELGSNEEIALLEVDLDYVNRIRQRGIKGLGQP